MDSTLQNTSSISEQKYINLRKRLDQLGYRQTLGIESLPLIEKLFNDLVHTTESLKKSKLELNKSVDNLNTSLKQNLSLNGTGTDSTTQVSIQAYKSDNAKLIKENNELHLQLIQSKDDFEAKLRDFKIGMNKIQHENSDLRFLNTQYLHKLRAIEKESKDKSKKILELQEKNFQAVIQTPNGAKQPISFRRQRLDIDCMLPATGVAPKVPRVDDPYIIDMIKLADERMGQLQVELDDCKQAKEMLESKLANFKAQVDNRTSEIERLNRQLDGGRSHDVVTLEGTLRNNEKVISHQNIQIEFLQDKNHQLETKIADLSGAKRQVLSEKHRNENLSRGLKEIDLEKQRICDAADRERELAKYEVERAREEMCTMDVKMQQLEKENVALENRVNELKCAAEQRGCEADRLSELVAKVQDDKCKQSKRISKLIENERELVTELDAIKSGRKGAVGAGGRTKSLTAKLDSHIKNIENERDFFKQEVDTLQKALRNANAQCERRSRGLSESGNARASSKGRNQSKARDSCRDTEHQRSRSKTPVRYCGGPSKCCCSCNGPSRLVSTSCGTSPVRGGAALIGVCEDVRQIRRERDELQGLLDKFEIHMADVQANVARLTEERDRLAMDCEEATRELCLTKSRSSGQSLAGQSMLKRIESERSLALNELAQCKEERDTLRDRIRAQTQNFIKEKASVEQQVEDLQVMLRQLEQDKRHMGDALAQVDVERNRAEDEIRQLNHQLSQVSQELNGQRSTATQIRLLAEESERALDDQQRQLSFKSQELSDLEQANYKLEQRLYDVQECSDALKDECAQLRATVAALDKEKDRLVSAVDEKCVESVQLKTELTSKSRCIDELNEQLQQLESACDRLTDENKQRNKETTNLRIQLDRCSESGSELARRLEAGQRENKRVQDDLITVTRENQVIHCELDKCNGDKQQLKEQCNDQQAELNRLNEVVANKEQERSQLLEQYRNLSTELNNLKMTVAAFDSESNQLKIDLSMKHNDNKRLRERNEALERDLQQHFTACQEYEVKLSGANRNAQRLEDTFKKLQHENKELAQDLMGSRELSARLEQNKEDLMRQVTSKELDLEQMNNELGDKRAENDLLKSQINSERAMVKNLEELIACNREKDFQHQLSHQERDSELKLLKDRICLGEQKIQSQNKEITMLRSKLVENESDIERMKRQITNERFEREKCAQELRKYNETSLMLNAAAAAAETSSRYTSRCHSPVRLPLPCSSSNTPPACNGISGAAAAVAAARAAVDASMHASSMTSCYRSISPVRSRSPCKESRSHLFSSESSTCRYSTHYDSNSDGKRQSHSPSRVRLE